MLIPAQNSIYQRNIQVSHRARLFGFSISLGMIVSVGVTFIAGRLLDLHEQSYHWILALTGVSGFVSSYLLSRVRIQEPITERVCGGVGFRKAFFEPITGTLKLLKENKGFAAFERSFSIYGMGFIMMQPIIPIYLVDKLQLSYTTNFLAKGIVSQLGMLLLSPLIGKLHDRTHPFRFISVSFALLMVFPCLIVVSSLWRGEPVVAVGIVFLAYLVFGIAMTGVNIAWNMSSIYFAGDQDASIYQSVHVTMTGIRGLIAPVLGFALLRLFNITAVFVVAAGFLLWASLISYRDYLRLRSAPSQ